jgi:hypothetical protein
MIPSFLLAKLYAKGSLKNNDSGFEFNLKNIIDSTTLVGIGPVVAGEKSYESDAISLIVAEKLYKGDELTQQNSIPVRMGVAITVKIVGDKLPAGLQKISVSATTRDIGKIKFDISDKVS